MSYPSPQSNYSCDSFFINVPNNDACATRTSSQGSSSTNGSPQKLKIDPLKSLKVISSKYDFVKVKVYLSKKHYYILSRFLVSRVLTATQVHLTMGNINLKKN